MRNMCLGKKLMIFKKFNFKARKYWKVVCQTPLTLSSAKILCKIRNTHIKSSHAWDDAEKSIILLIFHTCWQWIWMKALSFFPIHSMMLMSKQRQSVKHESNSFLFLSHSLPKRDITVKIKIFLLRIYTCYMATIKLQCFVPSAQKRVEWWDG